MKKKIFTAIATAVCALCCAVGLAACGGNSGGNQDGATDKVAEFVRVTDGVFTSAGYTKGAKQASSKQLTAQSADGGLGENLSNLYTALKNDTNLSAVGGNLNYIKCDTLYQGANLAGLVKSIALTVGDEVFSDMYDLSALGMQGYSAKIGVGDWYTLQGVGKSGGAVASAIEINFREYADGAFLFKLAQYDSFNGVARLSFSCYDSDGAAFTAVLQGNESANFSAYDTAYSAFTVQQCRLVIYGKTQYVSSSTDTQSIMKFAKDSLGFTNNTYSALAGLSGGKTLSEAQVEGVSAQMAKNYYTNRYSPVTDDKKTGVESVSIDSSLSLKVGDFSNLSVTVTPDNAVYNYLEWSSSNEKVATVSNGKVTAVGEGKATITVTTDNGKSADCTVTVTKKQTTDSDTNEVKDIALNHTAMTLYYGADSQTKATLTATISPANPEAEKQIKWTAMDSDYVILSGSGATVTVAAGNIGRTSKATTTVTASVGGKSADCEITIKKVEYVSVWVYDNGTYCDNMELDVGESLTLEYDLTPADIADLYHFEWRSSDETVATVSDSGVVKMIGYGEADIYCTAGGESARFTVYKQAPPVEVESITLNKTALTLTVGEGEKLIATVLPADAEDKSVVWDSTDSSVAGVNYYTGEVYAAKKGTATITATAKNGVYAECAVTVNAATVPDRDPEIALNKTNITLESDGDETLIATVADGISAAELIWRTSDSDVVKVSNGLVTAVGVGGATVTVYTPDYRYSATCSVTVTEPAEKRLTYTKIIKDGEVAAYSVRGIGTLADEEHVTIPAEYKGKPVTAVGKEALWNGAMTRLTVSDGVQIIEDGAFALCQSLISVTVPDSVERIGYGAFYRCNSIQEISVPFIGESAETTENNFFAYIFNYRQDNDFPSSLEKVTVRGGAEVAERAFKDLKHITRISLPAATKIANSAFNGCSALSAITLSETLESIGIMAFYGCTSLMQITLPDSLVSIGTNAFGDCTSLSEITLPFIGERADATGVTVFGHIFGAEAYGDNALVVPASLKKVTLSGGETVRERVFYGCSGIEEIVLPVGLLRINEKAFYGCGLTKLTVPSTVVNIGKGALEKCDSLSELSVPFLGSESGSGFAGYIFGQTSTDVSASQYIPATLEKIVITGEKIYIADNAFASCTGLKQITFEGKVMQIGSYAFDHCDLDIYFNGTKKEWEDTYKLQKWNSYLVATIHCSDGNVTEINNY